jgi:hypothetical protein
MIHRGPFLEATRTGILFSGFGDVYACGGTAGEMGQVLELIGVRVTVRHLLLLLGCFVA